MKVKEYLGQAYRLDQRINSDIEELGKLREMSSSISSVRHLKRQAFTFPAAVSGRNRAWCLAGALISGSTSHAFTDGRKKANISGIPTGNRLRFGSLISRRKTVTIRP